MLWAAKGRYSELLKAGEGTPGKQRRDPNTPATARYRSRASRPRSRSTLRARTLRPDDHAQTRADHLVRRPDERLRRREGHAGDAEQPLRERARSDIDATCSRSSSAKVRSASTCVARAAWAGSVSRRRTRRCARFRSGVSWNALLQRDRAAHNMLPGNWVNLSRMLAEGRPGAPASLMRLPQEHGEYEFGKKDSVAPEPDEYLWVHVDSACSRCSTTSRCR